MNRSDNTHHHGAGSADKQLRDDLRHLPAAENEPGHFDLPAVSAPAKRHLEDPADNRPLLVKDDFVLNAADPVSEEERKAASAERRRRRELRRAVLKKRQRQRRILVAIGLVLLLVVAFIGWLRWTTGGLDRIPDALNKGTDTPGTTILFVGSDPTAHDEVSGDVTWKKDLEHSDLVMLVHLPEDGEAMYGISLPGRLHLPLSDGSRGHVGSIMDSDGQGAYVDTVEAVTGVHVDHLSVLNLSGLQEVIDTLGGINVHVQAAGCEQKQGQVTLDGQGALELIRYRDCLPRGDLDRVSRQQSVLKGILAALVDGALPNPFKLNTVARQTFSNLAVDEGWTLWSMAGTAWSQRSVTPRTTTFLTVPTERDPKGRLTIAEGRAAELWEAVKADRLDEYVALNREMTN